MLAVNHPTPFLEPCILASFLKNPLYSLTRGDIFSTPFYRFLLRQYLMIPIYRFRDGYAELKQNAATFRLCYKAWSEGKTIVIFSEGNTVTEKRLRPIQKGTARMAFGAWEEFPDLDLYIVPVGVNFTDPRRYRGDAMLEFGEPIRVQDYRELFEEHPVKAVNQLTAELARRMAALVIIIDRVEDEEFTEQLLDIYRHNQPVSFLPSVSTSNKRLHDEKNIAGFVNLLSAEDKADLKQATATYFNQLADLRISDEAIAKPAFGSWYITLFLLSGILPFLVGYIFHAPLLVFFKRLSFKLAKGTEFYGPLLWGITTLLFLLYYVLLIIVAFVFVNNYIILFVFTLPILGYYAILYRDLYLKWRSARRFFALKDEIQRDLKEKREYLNQIALLSATNL